MPYINFPIIGEEKSLPYYVCGIATEFSQNNIDRPNGFYHPQFIIFTKGEGEITIEGNVYYIKPLTAIYIPKDVPHEYHKTSDNWVSWWVNFDGYDIDKLLDILGFCNMSVFTIRDIDRILRVLRRIYNCMEQDKLYGNYYASVALYDFFIEFYKCTKKLPDIKNRSSEGLEKVISYIDKEYKKKLPWKHYAV